MPRVRLLTGEKAGEVVDVDAELVGVWLVSGRAELVVEPKKTEKAETPERRRRRPETPGD